MYAVWDGVELFEVIHEWPTLGMLLARCLGMGGLRGGTLVVLRAP